MLKAAAHEFLPSTCGCCCDAARSYHLARVTHRRSSAPSRISVALCLLCSVGSAAPQRAQFEHTARIGKDVQSTQGCAGIHSIGLRGRRGAMCSDCDIAAATVRRGGYYGSTPGHMFIPCSGQQARPEIEMMYEDGAASKSESGNADGCVIHDIRLECHSLGFSVDRQSAQILSSGYMPVLHPPSLV